MRNTHLIVLGAVLLIACGGGGVDTVGNDLTFVPEDGPSVTMGTNMAICCGPWEAGYDERDTLKLFYYNRDLTRAFWKLFIDLDAITLGQPISLPSGDYSPLNMFVHDGRPIGNVDGNELSSSVDLSSGTITLHALSCDSPLQLNATVDVVLGSEYGDTESMAVRGEIFESVDVNPSPLGCNFSL